MTTINHKDLPQANGCPMCGWKPWRSEKDGEYDGDFLYPLGHYRLPNVVSPMLHSKRLLVAHCSEVDGGCGHIAVGFSREGALEAWNNYHTDPSLLVKYDLPLMEKAIAAYEPLVKAWETKNYNIASDSSLTSDEMETMCKDQDATWAMLMRLDWSRNQATYREMEEVRARHKDTHL